MKVKILVTDAYNQNTGEMLDAELINFVSVAHVLFGIVKIGEEFKEVPINRIKGFEYEPIRISDGSDRSDVVDDRNNGIISGEDGLISPDVPKEETGLRGEEEVIGGSLPRDGESGKAGNGFFARFGKK